MDEELAWLDEAIRAYTAGAEVHYHQCNYQSRALGLSRVKSSLAPQ